jgi:hypothetical protein
MTTTEVETRAIVFVAALALLGISVPSGAGTSECAPVAERYEIATDTTRARPSPRSGGENPPPKIRPFQSDGAVNQALTTILKLRKTGAPPAGEGRRATEIADAENVLRKNSATAAATLVQSLKKLAADDVARHATLLSLLAPAAHEAVAIDYLLQKVMSGKAGPRPIEANHVKDPAADKPLSSRSEHVDPERLIRYMAMSQLHTAARMGSRRASQAILESLRSPHRDVKITAVQMHYALSRSRLQARARMRALLRPEDRHLLYRY